MYIPKIKLIIIAVTISTVYVMRIIRKRKDFKVNQKAFLIEKTDPKKAHDIIMQNGKSIFFHKLYSYLFIIFSIILLILL